MAESPVFRFDGNDPEMQRAYEKARATFRYFWREMSWERRRIIPALDFACVKAPFSDGEAGTPAAPGSGDNPEVEHMWMSEVDFDGDAVSGVVINSPNWLKTVKEGDAADFPLEQISDWMYAIGGEVCGGFTVNLMRSRMGRQEREEHDAAWGLSFGDPAKIRVVPERKKSRGILKNWFGRKQANPDDEHPMSVNMAPSFREQLREDPSLVSSADDRGWTFLHQESLAGNLATVKVLLDAGADPNAITASGKTPLQLARTLGWEGVAAELLSRGAR